MSYMQRVQERSLVIFEKMSFSRLLEADAKLYRVKYGGSDKVEAPKLGSS